MSIKKSHKNSKKQQRQRPIISLFCKQKVKMLALSLFVTGVAFYIFSDQKTEHSSGDASNIQQTPISKKEDGLNRKPAGVSLAENDAKADSNNKSNRRDYASSDENNNDKKPRNKEKQMNEEKSDEDDKRKDNRRRVNGLVELSGGDLLTEELVDKFVIGDTFYNHQHRNFYASDELVTIAEKDYSADMGEHIEAKLGFVTFRPNDQYFPEETRESDFLESNIRPLFIDPNTGQTNYVTGLLTIKPHPQQGSFSVSDARKLARKYNIDLQDHSQASGLFHFYSSDTAQLFHIAQELEETQVAEFSEVEMICQKYVPL